MRPLVVLPAATGVLLIAVVGCVLLKAHPTLTLAVAIASTTIHILTLPHILGVLDRTRHLAQELSAEQEQVRACLRTIDHTNKTMVKAARNAGLSVPEPPLVPLTYAGRPVFPEKGTS